MENQSKPESGNSRKVLIIAGIGCILLAVCCAAVVLGAAAISTQIARDLSDTDVEVTGPDGTDGSPTPSPTPEAGSVKNPYKSTQQVKIDNVTWKIESAADLGGRIKADAQYLDDCVSEGSKFIKVVFSVTNGTDSSVNLFNIELADLEDRRFSEYNRIYSCVQEYTIFDELNPQLSKTYTAYFEVPGDKPVQNLMLVVSDLSFFSPEERYINLGL
ncbi:MAG: Telomeric repeat-binding factor 2 [candidate division WS6 bacterium OLB20]|uniref:Telomeric repeat-binding factor 2 n=1 Tax=candidate division WS6 bacterium OLB20 TaxID=1617426 RepID=A0A136LZ31_9BACT|nr:MAG: Telomeric repeat-binding factor 2 [candidate division WS6 bacterium OLB20]